VTWGKGLARDEKGDPARGLPSPSPVEVAPLALQALVRYEECLAQSEGADSTDVHRRSCNEKMMGTSATLRTGLPFC
jgi:hypothetical protein